MMMVFIVMRGKSVLGWGVFWRVLLIVVMVSIVVKVRSVGIWGVCLRRKSFFKLRMGFVIWG